MATIIPFLPSNIIAPSFHATLDGASYKIVVTWNISAQRFYVNIYAQDGTWIITVPLISTPPGRGVQSAVYDPFLNIITVTMVDPSLWPVPLSKEGLATPPGTIVDYTLEGFSPNTYNGEYRCMHLNPTTFTFPMPTDPGTLAITGTVNRLMDMAKSVFTTSTLVYRNGAFEVNP